MHIFVLRISVDPESSFGYGTDTQPQGKSRLLAL